MTLLIYGPDTFRSRQKLNEIVDHYKKANKKGLGLKYLDAAAINFDDFQTEIQQNSIFNEKKLIVLRNVFVQKDFRDRFYEDYKDISENRNIILLFEEKEIPGGDKLLKLLEKETQCEEFPFLEGERLIKWAKREFQKRKSLIDPMAINKLVEFVGNDLWQLDNEIEKLACFKKDGKIDIKDVELLVRPKIETDIFKTIDAIAKKDKKKAILLLHKHLIKGEAPLYLLSMIAFQFRNLLIVKDLMEKQRPYYSISKALKMHPFLLRKSYQQAGSFSYAELKKIYQKIFQVDLDIKTGKLKPETALDLFLTEI